MPPRQDLRNPSPPEEEAGEGLGRVGYYFVAVFFVFFLVFDVLLTGFCWLLLFLSFCLLVFLASCLLVFLASWLLGFLVSWFLGFLASWLLVFLASCLLGFLTS